MTLIRILRQATSGSTRACLAGQPTGYTAAEISSTSGAHGRASLLVLQRCKNSTTTTTSTGTGTTSKGALPTPTAGVAPRGSRALTCRSCQGHLETRTEASGGSSVRCANCSSGWVPAAFGANSPPRVSQALGPGASHPGIGQVFSDTRPRSPPPPPPPSPPFKDARHASRSLERDLAEGNAQTFKLSVSHPSALPNDRTQGPVQGPGQGLGQGQGQGQRLRGSSSSWPGSVGGVSAAWNRGRSDGESSSRGGGGGGGGGDEGSGGNDGTSRQHYPGAFSKGGSRSRSPDMEAMVPIMKAVGKTCTAVSRLVRRAQIDGMAGLHQEGSAVGSGGEAAAESVNVQGEVQKELDVLANSIFLTGLCQPHSMSCVASEEEEVPRMCAAVVGDHKHGGEYAAVFDPLDGSANIEAGLPCGTIFGILRTSGSTREGRKAGPGTIVLPGRRLVAAGYCLYGPSTKLVFTLGNGVFEFTLEGEGAAEQQEAGWRLEAGNSGSGRGSGSGGSGRGLGGGSLNFVLSKSNMRIPQSGKVYSVNEANSPSWSGAIQDYFRDLKTSMANDEDEDDDDDEEDPSSQDTRGGGSDVENQYAGALVADIHNILINGGVFAYPADVHNPNGKLRLLYEGNPMAMIIEQAGGVATTGFERIMDVRPQSVHHRIPAFFGSPENLLPLLNPRYLDSKRKR